MNNIKFYIMKKFLTGLFALVLILSSFSLITSVSYEADIAASTITWAGSRPGKTHDGTLAISKGNLVMEEGNLTGGAFTIDMNSIAVSDIPQGKMNDRLVGHLKSADFFDVENHQTASFEITSSQAAGDQVKVFGKLTIKGITKDIEFLASVSLDDGVVVLKSESFNIDRTLWDVKYRSGKFFDNLKNKMISDDIAITVTVKANKS